MNYCPKRAIETAHSFFFAVLFATIFLVNPYLSEWTRKLLNPLLGDTSAAYDLIFSVVKWSSAVLIFAIAYRLIHYLSRFRFFNRLLTYTSFTYWKFWRRYKAPKGI
jgi:hypothetical protein